MAAFSGTFASPRDNPSLGIVMVYTVLGMSWTSRFLCICLPTLTLGKNVQFMLNSTFLHDQPSAASWNVLLGKPLPGRWMVWEGAVSAACFSG